MRLPTLNEIRAAAGALGKRVNFRGQRIAIVLTGGNIDRALFAVVLNESSSEATTH